MIKHASPPPRVAPPAPTPASPWARTSPSKPASADSAAPAVVRHPGCPQWGLGFLSEERDDKRLYDFEDGQVHSIAKAFWSKLEPVELKEEEKTALEQKVRGQRERASASKSRSRAAAPAPMSFDEQLARFEAEFPGGFAGEAFQKAERGAPAGAEPEPDAGAKRSKKKAAPSKEAAIESAKRLFSREEFSGLLGAGSYGEVFSRARQLHAAAGAWLHPMGDVIPFSKMPEERHRPFAEALFDLLHGEGELELRFDRLAGTLAEDKLATWPLVTVVPALFSPDSWVFVKPSFFEKQASILSFSLEYERAPSGKGYARMLGLAEALSARLRERGHEPRDFVDVYAFVWRTLSASKAKPAAPKPAEAPSENED